MTDGKEWVTIKIPKDTRDEAKDDPRTYEEIMRSGLGQSESHDTTYEEVMHKLEQIESAQANTVSAALETAESVDLEVDESAIATMVVEDLRASLPREIAEELGR